MTPPWRPSSASEIHEYYQHKFPTYMDRLPWWVMMPHPKQVALAFTHPYPARHTSRSHEGTEVVTHDFVRRSTKPGGVTVLQTKMDLLEFIQDPARNDPARGGPTLLHPDYDDPNAVPPLPTAVYYSLDNHNTFWVLGFDIDAKDVARMHLADELDQAADDVTLGDLREHGVVDAPPTPAPPVDDTTEPFTTIPRPDRVEYPYTYDILEQSIDLGVQLAEVLTDTIGFDETQLFYSGQGVHLYAFADDERFELTYQARKFLAQYIHDRLGYPIDEQVTWDRSRVMRLPFSLHSDVSRIVSPIEDPTSFDPRRDPVPQFLR